MSIFWHWYIYNLRKLNILSLILGFESILEGLFGAELLKDLNLFKGIIYTVYLYIYILPWSASLMTNSTSALSLENVCYLGDLCFFPLPQAVLTVSFILAKITNEHNWQWFWCCLGKLALCVGENYTFVTLWKRKAW